MEESTQGSSSQSKSVLVLSPAALLVKGGQYGELVLPSQLLAQRRRGREELVCGTSSALTDRQTDRHNSPAEAGSMWTGRGAIQGSGWGTATQTAHQDGKDCLFRASLRNRFGSGARDRRNTSDWTYLNL